MLTTLLTTALLASSATVYASPAVACPSNVHVMGIPPQNPRGNLGLLASTIEQIVQAFPGSTNETINYPNDSSHRAQAISKGMTATRKRIVAYSAACPKTKIILAGYSLGAIVMMDALCGPSEQAAAVPLSKSYVPHIIAAIGYGDETFSANQPWDQNAGSCTSNGSNARADPSACDAFASSIKEYCDQEDPLCCGTGWWLPSHYYYPTEYNNAVVQFCLGRYNGTIN